MAVEVAAPRAEASLNALGVSATLHCLAGCTAGEVTGMALGTVLGWSNLATVALAVGLAFLFGYSLTSGAAAALRVGARGCGAHRSGR